VEVAQRIRPVGDRRMARPKRPNDECLLHVLRGLANGLWPGLVAEGETKSCPSVTYGCWGVCCARRHLKGKSAAFRLIAAFEAPACMRPLTLAGAWSSVVAGRGERSPEEFNPG